MLCQKCDAKNLEDARFCSDCGTQLVAIPEQAAAPRTRPFGPQVAQTRPFGPQPALSKKRGYMKTCLMVSAALFVLVTFCAGIGAAMSSDEQQTAAMDPDPMAVVVKDKPAEAPAGEEAPAAAEEVAPADEAAPAIPEQQAAFIQTVESFYQPYQEAKNELQGSMQRSKREVALAALLPNRAVQDWTGTLESLDTNSEGNAYIAIRLDGTESITIATWTNAGSDVGTNSIIPSGSALYNKLAEMSAGDRVVFSGTFAASDRDYIAESSSTDAASMTTPGFVMVFADITKQE